MTGAGSLRAAPRSFLRPTKTILRPRRNLFLATETVSEPCGALSTETVSWPRWASSLSTRPRRAPSEHFVPPSLPVPPFDFIGHVSSRFPHPARAPPPSRQNTLRPFPQRLRRAPSLPKRPSPLPSSSRGAFPPFDPRQQHFPSFNSAALARRRARSEERQIVRWQGARVGWANASFAGKSHERSFRRGAGPPALGGPCRRERLERRPERPPAASRADRSEDRRIARARSPPGSRQAPARPASAAPSGPPRGLLAFAVDLWTQTAPRAAQQALQKSHASPITFCEKENRS